MFDKRVLSALLLCAGLLPAQVINPPAGGAGVPIVTTTPATCVPNQTPGIVFVSANGTTGAPFFCSAVNTWSAVGSSSVNITSSCGIAGGPITGAGNVAVNLTLDSQTGSTPFAIPNADCQKIVVRNNAAAVSDTIAQAGIGGNFPNGWSTWYQCVGAGGCTITPTTSTVDGAASVNMPQGVGILLQSDGSNYHTHGSRGTVNSVANDTNVTLTLSNSGALVTAGWTGTLAAARLNSNVFQACTNDTNVTCTAGTQTFTLGWTGTLAKNRTLATTVYTDQSNTFTTGTQNFSGVAHTLPMLVSATAGALPATCTAGETAFVTGATAGQNIYECASTNTWTQQLNSGGGGGGTPGGSSGQVQYNNAGAFGGFTPGGDVSFTNPNFTVTALNGTSLAGLATGLLKNTTSTGVPSIAISGVDYSPAPSGTTILKGNGSGVPVAAAWSDVQALMSGCSTGQSVLYQGTCVTAGGQAGAYTAVAFSSTPTFTAVSNTVNSWSFTFDGTTTNATASTSGLAAGELLNFKICQAATNPGRTFTWPSGFSLAATISGTASACTKQSFFWDGSTAVPIASATVDAGSSIVTETTAPSGNPASGFVFFWADSTRHTLTAKDSSGNTYVMPKILGSGGTLDYSDLLSGATAGGDLTGSLPNPTVLKVNGVQFAATPSTFDSIPIAINTNTVNYYQINGGSSCGDSSHGLSYSSVTHLIGCQSITGSAAAGGSNTQVQYNNAGSLGGITGFTTNGTTTMSSGAAGIFDLSASTGTAAFKVPSTTTNTATVAGVVDYDTTNSNYHGNSGADSIFGVVPTASVPATGNLIDASVASSKFLLHDSGIATANVVTLAGTQSLTNKTLTTPVLTGLPTGTGVASAATASTLASRDANANLTANNHISSFTSTATAAGTTTLTVGSTYLQYFTGTTTQTVALPVATTLVNGQSWKIINLSTGAVTVQTSGANTLLILAGGTNALVTCVNTAGGTGTASWDATPYQGTVITSGKALTVTGSMTQSVTDGSTVAFGTGGTVLYNGGALGTPSSGTLTNATGLPISTGVSGLGTGVGTFLATPTSANLASALTDETGSGAAVFGTSPTLTTPALGTPSALVLTNATGLPAAQVPAVLTTVGTSRTIANPSEIIVCTGTCTVTPPATGSTSAGMQFCVQNDDNISTVITIAAVTSVLYENTARTSYKTANTAIASSGAVKDQICMVARDATHWNVFSATGTWN